MDNELWRCGYCGHHILDTWDNVVRMIHHINSHLELLTYVTAESSDG